MKLFPKVFNTKTVKFLKSNSVFTTGIITFGVGTAYIVKSNIQPYSFNSAYNIETNPFFSKVTCLSSSKPQDSVISETKQHALYLTLHINPEASPVEVLKTLSKIESYIDKISPKDIRDEDNEILSGVGFGPNFLKHVFPSNAVENFAYEHRKGGKADMPSTGGDIFIHAKCHERGKLFELTQAIINNMPKNAIQEFEDIYGWVYKYGRDLSGFIDGTENPADPALREQVAVNPTTGGSYTMTQKWVHMHNVIKNTPDQDMENWIGRKRADSIALNPKPISSHVARVTGRTNEITPKPHLIVRQSQPYGSYSKDSGLFFIAYAKSPEAFSWMLDQMSGTDGHYDHVFNLSECKTGAYFYFPSKEELSTIYSKCATGKSWFMKA